MIQRAIAAPEQARRDRDLDHLRALRSRLAGPVVSREDAGWGRARLAWNLAAHQRPPLIAYPEPESTDQRTGMGLADARSVDPG
jgi:hypothetical protein